MTISDTLTSCVSQAVADSAVEDRPRMRMLMPVR